MVNFMRYESRLYHKGGFYKRGAIIYITPSCVWMEECFEGIQILWGEFHCLDNNLKNF